MSRLSHMRSLNITYLLFACLMAAVAVAAPYTVWARNASFISASAAAQLSARSQVWWRDWTSKVAGSTFLHERTRLKPNFEHIDTKRFLLVGCCVDFWLKHTDEGLTVQGWFQACHLQHHTLLAEVVDIEVV